MKSILIAGAVAFSVIVSDPMSQLPNGVKLEQRGGFDTMQACIEEGNRMVETHEIKGYICHYEDKDGSFHVESNAKLPN